MKVKTGQLDFIKMKVSCFVKETKRSQTGKKQSQPAPLTQRDTLSASTSMTSELIYAGGSQKVQEETEKVQTSNSVTFEWIKPDGYPKLVSLCSR